MNQSINPTPGEGATKKPKRKLSARKLSEDSQDNSLSKPFHEAIKNSTKKDLNTTM